MDSSQRNLRAWAQLVRVPNTLTAVADGIAGCAVMMGTGFLLIDLAMPLTLLCIGSIAFYWSGMVLNDVCDIEMDRLQQRPGPLVVGHISVKQAAIVGWSLLAIGILLALVAGWLVPQTRLVDRANLPIPVRLIPAAIACLLALCIVGYDMWFKSTFLAPWIMGLCRGFNMMVGMALAWMVTEDATIPWTVVAIVLASYVLYITGITIAARREADETPSRWRSLWGWGTCLLGLVGIATCSIADHERLLRLNPTREFPLMIGLLMLPWLRRVVESLRLGTKPALGQAIRQSILSIIFIDASLTTQFAGTVPGIVVCSFILPTLLLANAFRTT